MYWIAGKYQWLSDVDGGEYVQRFSKLAIRPDLHPFYCEAIEIDLT